MPKETKNTGAGSGRMLKLYNVDSIDVNMLLLK